MPIDIVVEFFLRPGTKDEFESVLLPHIERVAAEETCLLMVVNRSPEDETRYLLYERWADRDEFWGVQMNRSYRVPYNARVEPLEAKPRRVTTWEPMMTRDRF